MCKNVRPDHILSNLHIDDIAILDLCVGNSGLWIQPFAIENKPASFSLFDISNLFEARHDLTDEGSRSNFQKHRFQSGAVQHELDIRLFLRLRLSCLLTRHPLVSIRYISKPILSLLEFLP